MKSLIGANPARASAILVIALLSGATDVAVAKAKEAGAAASATAATSPAKKAKASSTKFKILPGGSGESPAERATRLRRECKGRVNAGACEGYTG